MNNRIKKYLDAINNWFKKYLDTIMAVSNSIIALFAIIGIISGIIAYKYYKAANEIAYNNVLESSDNKIYDISLENNKPYLLRVMYYSPPDNTSSRMKANLYFQALFDNDVTIKWNTIPELISYYHNNLNIIRSNDGQRITEAILVYEKILGMCESVLFYSGNKHRISNEWNDYCMAYINDFGDNPYFLAAIHLDHVYGYIGKDFSILLRDQYKNDNVVKEVYPQMFMPHWLELHGKKKLL